MVPAAACGEKTWILSPTVSKKASHRIAAVGETSCTHVVVCVMSVVENRQLTSVLRTETQERANSVFVGVLPPTASSQRNNNFGLNTFPAEQTSIPIAFCIDETNIHHGTQL